jgi:ABC-type nitrate/sulfonate/bicarbonate transport system ATPase subunit
MLSGGQKARAALALLLATRPHLLLLDGAWRLQRVALLTSHCMQEWAFQSGASVCRWFASVVPPIQLFCDRIMSCMYEQLVLLPWWPSLIPLRMLSGGQKARAALALLLDGAWQL